MVTYHTARNWPKKKGGCECKSCFENTHHWTLCTNQESHDGENNLNVATTSQFTEHENTDKKEVSLGYKYTINPPYRLYGDNKFKKIDEPKPKDFAPMVVAEIMTGDGRWMKANCFLDTGSNSSLIRLKFAKQAMFHGSGASDVQFEVAGGGIHRERAEEFELHIRPLNGDNSYLILTTGIKKPCSKMQPISPDIFKHRHLKEFRDKVHTRAEKLTYWNINRK